MDPGAKLRALCKGGEAVPVASIHNGLAAKLAELAGFGVAVLGGASVSNSLLALPDSGLVTLTEMEFVLTRVSSDCSMPILVDVDGGYGDAVNVVRTVRTLEQAGAAGIIIEDQEDPPRCGHVSGHVLVSAEEMVGKLRAALDSRHANSFVIIARTDARSVHGLDAAIKRGQQYVDAGVDGFLADAVMSADEVQRLTDEVPAQIHLVNLGGSSAAATTPKLALSDLQAMGVHLVTTGMSSLRVSALALLRYYQDVHERGPMRDLEHRADVAGTPLEEWYEFTGFDWVHDLEVRYLPPDLLGRRYSGQQEGYYRPDSGPR